MAIVKKVRKLGSRGVAVSGPREDTGLRPEFVLKAPPCATACPNDTDVRALLAVLARPEAAAIPADRSFEQAFRILSDRNPLPATSAALCPHRCEEACHRAGYDEAIAINAIERFVAEHAVAAGFPLSRVSDETRPERVAILGAGAAGLSSAYQLARRGYGVAVFDPFPLAGGELRYSALAARLTPGILDAEIDRLLAIGVEFRPGIPVAEAAAFIEQDGSFVKTLVTRIYEVDRPVEPASVVPAIHLGRHQAALAEAAITEAAPAPVLRMPSMGRDRLKLDHYPHAERALPRNAVRCSSPDGESAGRAGELSALAAEQVLAEARRCLSCGDCFSCGNCWKYCPDQAVIKPLEASQSYRFRLEFCQGCSKCAEECPSGYIEMR